MTETFTEAEAKTLAAPLASAARALGKNHAGLLLGVARWRAENGEGDEDALHHSAGAYLASAALYGVAGNDEAFETTLKPPLPDRLSREAFALGCEILEGGDLLPTVGRNATDAEVTACNVAWQRLRAVARALGAGKRPRDAMRGVIDDLAWAA